MTLEKEWSDPFRRWSRERKSLGFFRLIGILMIAQHLADLIQ
jgi:hypothetical protein